MNLGSGLFSQATLHLLSLSKHISGNHRSHLPLQHLPSWVSFSLSLLWAFLWDGGHCRVPLSFISGLTRLSASHRQDNTCHTLAALPQGVWTPPPTSNLTPPGYKAFTHTTSWTFRRRNINGVYLTLARKTPGYLDLLSTLKNIAFTSYRAQLSSKLQRAKHLHATMGDMLLLGIQVSVLILYLDCNIVDYAPGTAARSTSRKSNATAPLL